MKFPEEGSVQRKGRWETKKALHLHIYMCVFVYIYICLFPRGEVTRCQILTSDTTHASPHYRHGFVEVSEMPSTTMTGRTQPQRWTCRNTEKPADISVTSIYSMTIPWLNHCKVRKISQGVSRSHTHWLHSTGKGVTPRRWKKVNWKGKCVMYWGSLEALPEAGNQNQYALKSKNGSKSKRHMIGGLDWAPPLFNRGKSGDIEISSPPGFGPPLSLFFFLVHWESGQPWGFPPVPLQGQCCRKYSLWGGITHVLLQKAQNYYRISSLETANKSLTSVLSFNGSLVELWSYIQVQKKQTSLLSIWMTPGTLVKCGCC